jgi:molybdopterin molybdotransferase
MRPFGVLTPVETARERLLAAARPVRGLEELPLDAALGRVSARAVRATRPVPAFPRASWDGYAVRSADTRGARSDRPARLRIVGEIFAEDALGRPLGKGESVAIATGGCLPEGADAVAIFEDVRVEGTAVELRRSVPAGTRVARIGDDYARGAPVVAKGEVLSPAALGGLGAVGRATATVLRRPVVAIVPNGNELVAPGERLGRGQIHESNNRTLSALVAAAGGVPRPVAPVPDDARRIEVVLRRELGRADLVLVTGGSSVGERDYLPAIFPKLGRLLFHGVAVRPGKPTLAAVARGKLLVGMPGHPTSCLANGFWLLLPVLRRLAGLPGPGWVEGRARLSAAAGELTPGLSTVVPLRIERGRATPTFHDSSAITSLAGANAFALLEPGSGRLEAGTELPVRYLLPPLASPPSNLLAPVGES